MQELKVDIPYPKVEKREDYQSVKIIAPSYAGKKGEITAVLLYAYDHVKLKGLLDDESATLMTEISLAEMHHAELLSTAILNLGTNPIYTGTPPFLTDFYSTEQIPYAKTAEKILLDAITGELDAIAEYKRELSLLANEQVGALIERIILDEMLHVEKLKDRLNELTSGV